MIRRKAAIAFLLLASCGRQQQPQTRLNHYQLQGTVVRLEPKQQSVVVKHGPITGEDGKLWMEAMTMEFPVKDPQQFALLHTGQQLRARVTQNESDLDYWLDQIIPLDAPLPPTPPATPQ